MYCPYCRTSVAHNTVICPVCKANLQDEYAEAHKTSAPSGNKGKPHKSLKNVVVVLSVIAFVSVLALIATLVARNYSFSERTSDATTATETSATPKPETTPKEDKSEDAPDETSPKDETGDVGSPTKALEWQGVTIQIPKFWLVMKEADNTKTAGSYSGGQYAYITHMRIEDIGEVELSDLAISHVLYGPDRKANKSEIIGEPSSMTLDNGVIKVVRVESKCSSEHETKHYLEQWIRTTNTYTLVATSCREADWEDCKDELTQILDSLHIENLDTVGISDNYIQNDILDA